MLTQSQLNQLKQSIKCFTAHWSAGDYSQTFSDYHICVPVVNDKAIAKQTLSLMTKGAHTWKRNTGNIGISFMAMEDHNHSVRADQIEVMAKTIAELCILLDLDPEGTYDALEYTGYHGGNTTLTATGNTFKAPVIADHCFYAEKDGYGPHGSKERFDIGDPSGIILWNGKIIDLLPGVKKKANWYYSKLKSGEIKREHTLNLY